MSAHDRRESALLIVTLVVIALLACCSGCSTTPAPMPVNVPMPVACQEVVPDRPAMPTEALQAGFVTLHQYVTASQAEIERREGYEGRLRAALVACTTPLQGD